MAKIKGNLRSMRLSDNCLDLIESQFGESFTAKFENLVHHCIEELPEKEKYLELLKSLIKAEEIRLDRIRKEASELERCISDLQRNLLSVNRLADRAISNLDSLINDS